jgi:hypothetical protein
MPLLRPTAVLTAIEEDLIEEPLWQRLMANVVVMALLTGGALRLYRAIVLQYGWSNSWLWVGGTFLGQAAILFLLATLYLGNYHAKSWAWRAPLFALLEVATEAAVSYVLLRMGLETAGSHQATLIDWQRATLRMASFRLIGIPLFALVLALVSTVVRAILLPKPTPASS